MRKMLVAGVLSTIAIVGTAVPAAAQPPGQERFPEEFVCDGEDTLIVTAGRNGWIDGVKYHAGSAGQDDALRHRDGLAWTGRCQGRQQATSLRDADP
jgi:hypothetical protein